MANILLRIYRERRRIAIVMVLATIAGYLFYRHLPYEVGGVPIAFFTAGLYGLLFGISSLAVCLIFPSFRFAMEAFAVARVIYASFVASFPTLAAATVTSPFMNATIVVTGGFILSLVFYSGWVSRRLTCENAVCTVRLPGSAHVPARVQAPDDVLRQLCYTEGGAGPRGLLHRMFAPDATLSPTGQPPASIVFDRDETDRVTLQIQHKAMPWGTYLAAWVDDAYGRVYDRVLPQQAMPAPKASPATDPIARAA